MASASGRAALLAFAQTSDEWDERGRLRNEQIDGINKALEILTSGSARDTFQSATGNRVVDNFGSEGVDVDFLQVDQKKDPREKAFLVLKQMSRGTSNLRLARLAAAVRTTATGHFDEVISKNCRFLQGPATDPKAVQELSKGIKQGDDVTVTILNYRKDGTPFWNQLFVAALRDINKRVVNYVGVQIPVAGPLPKPGQTEPMPYPAKAAPA